jgi:hypothetical protein
MVYDQNIKLKKKTKNIIEKKIWKNKLGGAE